MYFRQFFDSSSAAMSYLLADLPSGQAVVIDPSPDPCQTLVLKALLAERALALRLILLTHSHGTMPDELLVHYPAAELRSGDDPPRLAACRRVAHGETLPIGDDTIQVIATPGHTAGSVSYLWRDRLFCGDALELGGCGQAGDGDCDPGRIYDSVTNRLFVLPDETLVFPGHDFQGRTVSTIGEERRGNPFFLPRSRDAFVTAFRTRRLRAAAPW